MNATQALTREEIFEGVGEWFHRHETKEVLAALGEYDRPYYTLYAKVRESLDGKTDKELKSLALADLCVTQTNCGWTSYAVAPMVAHEAQVILYARERASEGE